MHVRRVHVRELSPRGFPSTRSRTSLSAILYSQSCLGSRCRQSVLLRPVQPDRRGHSCILPSIHFQTSSFRFSIINSTGEATRTAVRLFAFLANASSVVSNQLQRDSSAEARCMASLFLMPCCWISTALAYTVSVNSTNSDACLRHFRMAVRLLSEGLHETS